jgi:hypothetical protein
MSFFSSIAAAEHTFAAWAEKELIKLEGVAPTFERIAGTVLTYAGPALQTVVTAEAGAPAGSIVGKVLQQAQADLTAASGLVYDFGPTPSVASILGSVQTNLSALLTAGHVTNSKSVGTVNKVATELSALVAALPAAVKPA